MNWVLLQKKSCPQKQESLLRSAIASEFLRDLILEGLRRGMNWYSNDRKINFALPDSWKMNLDTQNNHMFPYTDTIPLHASLNDNRKNNYHVISHGRFMTRVDGKWFRKILRQTQADVITIQVDPELSAYREKLQVASHGQIAGFRRIYADSARKIPVPTDWPHLLFIKQGYFRNDCLPISFREFLNQSSAAKLQICSLSIAGSVWDLETEKDFLVYFTRQINTAPDTYQDYLIHSGKRLLAQNQNRISNQARCFGNIIAAKSSTIEPNAILIGPSVIADNVKIKSGAVIQSSIIGPGITVAKNQVIRNRLLLNSGHKSKSSTSSDSGNNRHQFFMYHSSIWENGENTRHKTWSKFSYAGGLKRIVDISFAAIILILFAPFIPLLALAVKLTSAGPVFYRARRQGRYGREFHCLKFRTMIAGADEIQDRLREINQVDGPQFKIVEDPRLTPIGNFLRDTYLDEIPQFFNVLRGQMSVIGPRPSPEKENSLCAYWRDSRLSVRPGITGLWQVRRTRTEGQDFQEWIHYDTEYVNILSLKLDLRIGCQTAVKMLKNFAQQF